MATVLLPGDPRRLGGYWLAGRLGEGGQGVVYEAYDEAGRRVAVKVLRPAGGPGDARARARFAKEVAAARRVAPFCTARVIAADLEGPQPYIVSEFVAGPSLRAAVARDGPYGPGELHRLATGIATALAAIHGASVVHRDLKPDNVLIGPEGPRVIDFGIARTADMSLTTTGHVAGTPAFMAPESVLGARAGPAVDIWAWGAVTLFAATGREPFAEGAARLPVPGGGPGAAGQALTGVAALLHRILAAEPDLTALGEPLRGLVARALDKDPEARPDADTLLATLLGHPSPRGEALLAEGTRTAEGLGASRAGAPPSLAAVAEEAYGALVPADQALVPRILLRMVAPGEGNDDLPRPVPEDELLDGVVDRETAGRVLSGFARADLVVREGETVVLAATALLRAWPRLRGWVDADRAGLRVQRPLTEAARTWDLHGRRPGDLYQGTALETALGWAATARHHVTLNTLEKAFLDASRALVQVRARRRRRLNAALAVLVAVAATSAGLALNLKSSAERQRDVAVARRLAALAETSRSSDPTRAMALSVAAWRLAGVPEARAALYSSLAQPLRRIDPPPPVTAGARFDLSGDGRLLAVADAGRAVLWEVAAHRVAGGAQGIGPDPDAVALSPDGHRLAVSDGGRLRVWDLSTGRPLGPAFGNGALEMTFGPDGRRLAVLAPGHRGQVWDALRGVALLDVRDERAEGVEVSARHAVVLLDDGRYRLYEPVAGRAHGPRRLPAPAGGRADAVAFSPDGRTIAVGHGGNVGFWDLSTGRRRATVLEGASAVWLAYGDGGRLVLTFDRTGAGLWSADGGGLLAYSTPGDTTGMPDIRVATGAAGGPVLRYLLSGGRVATVDAGAGARSTAVSPSAVAAAFAPGARTLAVSPAGKGPLLWDPARDIRLGPPLGGTPAGALAFPDVHTLASVPAGEAPGEAATVSLWSVPDGRPLRRVPVAGAGSVGGLAVGGGVLAVAPVAEDYEPVRVWDLARGAEIPVPRRSGWDVMAVSPDGRVLAIGGRDAALVDLATGTVAGRPFGPVLDGVRSIAFSPGGSMIATGFHEAGVGLWDARTLRRTGTLAPEEGRFDDVVALAYSPDGRLIATGGTSGEVRLWDTGTRSPLGLPYAVHTGRVLALAFDADGRYLYSAGQDGTLRRYTIDPERAAAEVCARAGGALGDDDWRRLVPEAPYRKVC
ncbi:WD40 repeat domain-containing serine/threonine protein kinase [Microbispora catharanthi]|uniref:Protein kinase n=1 Tax=Microbispora catharanthi TaxID=1712871 RepID=A0A5N6BIZ7_9ACTN|nr:protein kinase [Microbispora catharanthi]KAB8180395.1 protein kinase [Microbispora catharanthi]